MIKPQPIGTCVILTNSENQILMGKRKNSYKSGMYGLPGGRIELGEQIISTATREIEEETGITGLDLTVVGVVREHQELHDFIHFVFTAQITHQEPKLCEPEKCEKWEWIDSSTEMNQVLPGHKASIELFKNGEWLADLA